MQPGMGGLRRWPAALLAALLAAALLGGCRGGATASLEGTGLEVPGGTGTVRGAQCGPGPAPLRRLTRREYNNTVHDLLGDTHRPADAFPAEEESHGFTNNASAQTMSPVLVEQYLATAEEVAARAVQDLGRLLPCDPAAVGEEACARRFIERFGRRAFRRPLASADVEDLLAVYREVRRAAGFRAGIEAVLQVLLQSPEFLYRLEQGVPDGERPGVERLDGYSVAARLSAFLWGSIPDDALLAAAADGRLDTPEGVAREAQRLLADPRARETVRAFHAQWLGLGRIDELAKDSHVFPDFDPSLRAHLRAEAEALIDHVLWESGGTLEELLTAPYTFLDARLAAYYGLPAPAGSGLKKVELPGRAAGLLTQGGLMAVLAKPNATSPVLRGKFVREALMCQVVPPPPDDVVVAPESDPRAPARVRLEQHLTERSCAGCHRMMDPIGFGFERFDAVGRYRTAEADGSPVDDAGEVAGLKDGAFQGVPALAARLARDPVVERCVAHSWFRFAQGRTEVREDLCTLESLEEAFRASGGRIPDLLLQLTQTDAFRFRSVPGSTQGGSP